MLEHFIKPRFHIPGSGALYLAGFLLNFITGNKIFKVWTKFSDKQDKVRNYFPA